MPGQRRSRCQIAWWILITSSRRAIALGLAALLLFGGTLTAQQPVSQLATGSTTATLQSAATANGNGTVLSVTGMATALLTINCASCSGGTTVNFEVTEDGTNWYAREGRLLGSSSMATSSANAGFNLWELPVAGAVSLRARISGYSAGTVTITGHAVPLTLQTQWVQLTNSGSYALASNQSVNISQVAGATISQTNPVPTVFPGTLISNPVTTAMTGTTSTSVIAGVASNYLYITQCAVSNGSTTVSTDILLQDGSGGTSLYVLPAPAATTASTGGSGAIVPFPVPLKVPTAGNGLFAANVTTGSSTKISCSGFRSTVNY